MTKKERKRGRIAGWRKQTKKYSETFKRIANFEMKSVAKTSARLATLKRNNGNRQR